MRIIIVVYAIISMNTLIVAQEKSFEEKMKMEVDSKDYSWFFKNVFFDSKYAIASEYFIIPDKEYRYLDYSYSSNNPDSLLYVDNGLLFTIFGLTFEPRINLINMPKSSIYIKSPMSFNFSITTTGDYRGKKKGFVHMTFPFLIGYSKGLNSNFVNTNNKGFAISGGIQIIRGPLFGGGLYTNESDFVGPESYELRNKWVMPVVQLDYYKLSRKTKIKGFSLIASVHDHFYFRLSLMMTASKK